MRTDITIKPWGHQPFTLNVGDKVIERIDSRMIEPAKLQVRTVTKICGGDVRQWMVLDGREERDTDGKVRGRDSWFTGSIEPYSDQAMAENAEQWRFHNERKALNERADALLQGLRGKVAKMESVQVEALIAKLGEV